MQQNIAKENLWGIAAVLFIFSLLFMLLIACWTSMLNPYFLYDSSVFCVLGKGWKEGLLPYRDIFDHKGCYLYACYALAAGFGNIKVGLTVLLTLLLTVDSLFVYQIARLFISRKMAWGIVLLFYILLAGMIGNCGCVEELSLPFILWPVYRLLRLAYRPSGLEEASLGDFFIIGLCGGIHAMLRLNNAGCVVGGALALFAVLLYRYKFVAAFRGGCVAAIGFLLALLPGVIYFAWQGALHDLWYGTILFNFLYAGSASAGSGTAARLLPHLYLIVLAGVLLADVKKNNIPQRVKGLVLSVSLIGSLAISIGQSYHHYFICVLPAQVITLSCAMAVFCLAQRKMLSLVVAVVVAVVTVCPYTSSLRRQTLASVSALALSHELPCGFLSRSSTYQYVQHYADHNRRELMQWVQDIPENEKRSFLAYNCFGDVYLYMNLLPEYKYCFIQEGLSRHRGSEVMQGLKRHFAEKPPLWLLMCRSDFSSPFYQEIIRENYRPVREGESYSLFRLNK